MKNIVFACLIFSVSIFSYRLYGAVPLFLGKEPNLSGLNRRITNVGNFSAKSIVESEYTETLETGRTVQVLVRLPFRNGTAATNVSSIVFMAPYPNDQFRTARSTLANALVVRLGCAVVAIPMNSPKEEYWARDRFYLYPNSPYFPLVERLIKQAREKFGTPDTPIFCVGTSGGAVMSLYLAQSKTLSLNGVVAFELSQDEEITPNLLDVRIPTLVLNPEDSPWNVRIAERHAKAVANGAQLEFCITRPIVTYQAGQGYYRRAGGQYANELAYCFLRDAIEAQKNGAWPQQWQRRKIKITLLQDNWEAEPYLSSDDFEKLYRLASHNACESSLDGKNSYAAEPPFYKKHAVLLLKKGIWNYLDQIRMGATLVRQGCSTIISSVPDTAALAADMPAQIARLASANLPITIVGVVDRDDDDLWKAEIGRLAGKYPCVFLHRGDGPHMPVERTQQMHVFLRARNDYTPETDYGSVLFADPTWILPGDFHDFVVDLVKTPAEQNTSPGANAIR